MADRPRLFLLDGTAIAYRAHFAFTSSSRGGLSTRDGKPTSATFGFTTTLRNRFDPGAYLGIEVELRQGMILRPAEQRAAGDLLANALRAVLHAAAGAIGSDRSG